MCTINFTDGTILAVTDLSQLISDPPRNSLKRSVEPFGGSKKYHDRADSKGGPILAALDPALCIYIGVYLMCIDNKHLTDKVPRGNGTMCRVIGIKLKQHICGRSML